MEVGAAGSLNRQVFFLFSACTVSCTFGWPVASSSHTNFIFALVDDVRSKFYIVMFLNFNLYVYFMLIKF